MQHRINKPIVEAYKGMFEAECKAKEFVVRINQELEDAAAPEVGEDAESLHNDIGWITDRLSDAVSGLEGIERDRLLDDIIANSDGWEALKQAVNILKGTEKLSVDDEEINPPLS